MPVNAGAEYLVAEKKYLGASSKEEKIKALEEMIRALPKHKGSENLLSELKRRLAKLKKEAEVAKKSGKSKPKFSIRKEGAATICLIGQTKSGKSSLLNSLTNAHAEVAEYPYTTKLPEVGMMEYEDVQLQLIEIPSIFDSEVLSLLEMADEVLILIDSTKDIDEQRKELFGVLNKSFDVQEKPYFFIFSKIDLKKIPEDYGYLEISTKSRKNLEELKKMIWEKLELIRIYTKEPGKPKVVPAIAFKKGATIKDVAKSVHKDFLKDFNFARVFNSTPFSGQKVGLDFKLKDLDVVEIHTK
jgi:hypothetical protein